MRSAWSCLLLAAAACAAADDPRPAAGLGTDEGSSTAIEAGTTVIEEATTSTGVHSSSSNESSTTAAPVCGDGHVDDGEDCDDGDDVRGDGCNADCQRSGELVWYAIEGMPASPPLMEYATRVAVTTEDGIVATGAIIHAEEAVSWAGAYGPEGDERWATSYEPDRIGIGIAQLDDVLVLAETETLAEPSTYLSTIGLADGFVIDSHRIDLGYDWLSGVRLEGQSDALVLTAATRVSGIEHLVVTRIAADLSIEWAADPVASLTIPYWLEAGALAIGEEAVIHRHDSSSWLEGYAGAGAPAWSIAIDTTDHYRDLAIAPNGDIVAVGEDETGRSVIVRFAPDGDVRWRFVHSEATEAGSANAVVIDIDDATIATGTEAGTSYTAGWLLRLGADGSPLWEEAVEIEGGQSFPYALALAANGDIAVGGSVLVPEDVQILVARFRG